MTQPMRTAPIDQTIIVHTRDGERVPAEWDPTLEYEGQDGQPRHGAWRTECGHVEPPEAAGWEFDVSRALAAHGG